VCVFVRVCLCVCVLVCPPPIQKTDISTLSPNFKRGMFRGGKVSRFSRMVRQSRNFYAEKMAFIF